MANGSALANKQASGPLWTAKRLRAFEDDIAAEFNAGKIAAPVHLADGNEAQLISLFRFIQPQDWVLTSWRSHYHCLLKGVPAPAVKAAIMAGRSIALCFPEYRVLSSAIVGGICPIAVGLAWSIKRNAQDAFVHVFVGDMSAETGIYHECYKYARGHELPINFVIEDNGKSVCTDTEVVWGIKISKTTMCNFDRHYNYELTRPHVGTGTFVRF